MDTEYGLIEKELTELLSKNIEKLRFPTGVKVIEGLISGYFDNYRQRKQMIEQTKGGHY